MTNLNYIKYFYDAARLKSIVSSAKVNYVSSSAISQAIKWLENHYQLKLVEHGKNKFNLTEYGIEFSNKAEKLLIEVDNFEDSVQFISKSKQEIFKFSVQQSIANTVVSKVIRPYGQEYPQIKLQVKIGTTRRCLEMMNKGIVKFSISMDNVGFDAESISLYEGKFVFISAKDDKRSPEEAGFITTEDTKEVIALKADYFKKFNKEIPISNTIASWGVIGNMALSGVGVAYVPDYFLKGIDRNKYRIRKVNLTTAKYTIKFYYEKNLKLSPEQLAFVKKVKMAFKEN